MHLQQKCCTERRMKTIRQFALIVAVLLPLVTPAMACILPGARLTPAERACCKQAAMQCGEMQMPALHNCCEKEMPAADQGSGAQLPSRHSGVSLHVISDLPFAALLKVPSNLEDSVSQHSLTLPQSPPAVISILRI